MTSDDPVGDKRVRELHERADARKKASEADRRYPVVFLVEAVDRIVGAVEADGASIPTDLDRRQLARDLDRALFLFRTLGDLGQSQAWTARKQRGKQLAKTARAFAELLARDDDAGQWWRGELGRWGTETRDRMARFAGIVDRLVVERFAEPGDPAALCGDNSPLDQLVGEMLADIFE
ncbi:hypothetical protein AB4144_26955, partial [Rhizobiaceae sp. 2RAB30]